MGLYLVTGCAGFIGSHLTDRLLELGHEVRGVDAFTALYPRRTKVENLAAAQEHGSFRLLETDVATARLEPLVDGVDGIFHLAAEPGVRGSWGRTFARYAHHNLVGTQRVCEAAAAGGVRLLAASSSSVYGNAATHPVSEDAAPAPISPYGVTKLAAEDIVRAYGAVLGLDAVILRYFTVYGPRQRPDMAFARLQRSLAEQDPFPVLGDGRQSRDFTYVSDAVEAAVVAFERATGGSLYNVGGGSETSLAGAIALAEDLAGRHAPLRREPAAAGDVGRTVADIRRIGLELGWSPEVPLEEGLARQLEAGALASTAGRGSAPRSSA